MPMQTPSVAPLELGQETVPWQTPTYDLVRMDAEIGSYQEDQDPGREA